MFDYVKYRKSELFVVFNLLINVNINLTFKYSYINIHWILEIYILITEYSSLKYFEFIKVHIIYQWYDIHILITVWTLVFKR